MFFESLEDYLKCRGIDAAYQNCCSLISILNKFVFSLFHVSKAEKGKWAGARKRGRDKWRERGQTGRKKERGER